MKHRILTLLFVISLILLALSPERSGLAQENPPAYDLVEGERATVITPVIGYQGRLVEGGTPVTGNRVMTFKLYSSKDGLTPTWSETKTVYDIHNGLFQTALGDTEPFEGYMNQIAHNMWLEVTVGGVVLPRQQLVGSPYAFSLAPGAWVIDDSDYSSAYFQNLGSGDGLAGYAASDGSGIEGESSSGVGVSGRSTSGHGIKSFSEGSGLLGASLYAYAYSPGGIALWAHNDSSTSSDAALVVSNDGIGALIKGFGGDSGEHEFMVKNNGDVEQALAADGLVKAGVYGFCSNSSPSVTRYFNGAGGEITISSTGTAGSCYINFGFDLTRRYWISQANYMLPNAVKCNVESTNNSRLICYMYNYDGTLYTSDGYVMVLVY